MNLMSLGNEWKFDSPWELDEFFLPLPNKNEKGDNSIYTCDANAPRWTTFRGWKKSSFRGGGGKNQIWNQLTAELPQPIPFPVVLVSSVTALYLIVWIGPLPFFFIIWVSNSQANLYAIFLFKPFFCISLLGGGVLLQIDGTWSELCHRDLS